MGVSPLQLGSRIHKVPVLSLDLVLGPLLRNQFREVTHLIHQLLHQIGGQLLPLPIQSWGEDHLPLQQVDLDTLKLILLQETTNNLDPLLQILPTTPHKLLPVTPHLLSPLDIPLDQHIIPLPRNHWGLPRIPLDLLPVHIPPDPTLLQLLHTDLPLPPISPPCGPLVVDIRSDPRRP